MGFVTITDVRVTGDLQHASVFYTVYGTDEERADTAAALKAATGMLRTEVGKNITARLTPSLEFIADAIPENAAIIDSLLREAQERDERGGRRSPRPPQYAGDADPYVKPREIDDEEDADEEFRVRATELLQQPRQHPVGERLAAGLAGRAVLEGRVGVDHLSDRVAADRAGQPGAAVHLQVGLLLGLELAAAETPSARSTASRSVDCSAA